MTNSSTAPSQNLDKSPWRSQLEETYLQTLVTPPGLQWLAGRYPRQDALRPGNGGVQ